LAAGLSRAAWPPFDAAWALAAIGVVPVIALERSGRRLAAVFAATAAAVAALVYLKLAVLGAIDREASARPLWLEIAPRRAEACVESLPRGLRYGLNYYSVAPLPDCAAEARSLRITLLR
ncbi:MAG: hypothetical protein ACRD96_18370, partial [Bryobacteraceae bacterium]